MIKHFTDGPGRMTQAEIDKIVAQVVGTLGTTRKDFEHASKMYNSDFFRDEQEEFQRSLCSALKAHFSGLTNKYWNRFAE